MRSTSFQMAGAATEKVWFLILKDTVFNQKTNKTLCQIVLDRQKLQKTGSFTNIQVLCYVGLYKVITSTLSCTHSNYCRSKSRDLIWTCHCIRSDAITLTSLNLGQLKLPNGFQGQPYAGHAAIIEQQYLQSRTT